MPRLPLTSTTPGDPLLREIFSEVHGRIEHIPALYRALGNSPAMLRAWIDLAWPLRLNSTTSRALRELVILRGAQIGMVEYEWAHHVPMALAAGVPQSKIDELAEWQASRLFTDEERAVLQLSEEITRGPGATEATWEMLQRFFSEPELVELVLTASFYVCVGRVLTSLAIELEPEFSDRSRATASKHLL